MNNLTNCPICARECGDWCMSYSTEGCWYYKPNVIKWEDLLTHNEIHELGYQKVIIERPANVQHISGELAHVKNLILEHKAMHIERAKKSTKKNTASTRL